MAQVADILAKRRGVYIHRIRRWPPQIKPFKFIIHTNGNGVHKCDPPHDWLDDPLEALKRLPGPYTFENADEYLDTEPVELYNGWLVRQQMSDYDGKGFEGGLHEHVSGAARLYGFGRVLPDQMECLLDDGLTVKPDLSMVSKEREKQRVKPHGPNDRSILMGSPEFVVEIRSPSNRRVQEKDKRERYFKNGAEIIWDIDEKAEIIYVSRADDQDEVEKFSRDDEIDCEPLLPGWRRRVSDLFEKEASVEVVLSEVVDTYQGKGEQIGEERGKEIGRAEGEQIGEERGKEIGRAEGEQIGEERGKEIGRAEGKQEMLIRLLQVRFPDLSEQALAIVNQTEDVDQLDSWFNQVLMAQSLDELPFNAEI